ncbi:sulfotransferase family protein [Methylomonas sp. MgM2]
MKKPNFFILGAPKCGTTSLAAWLSEHPQVYMSPHKEPLHFNTGDAWITTPDREDYERLFRGANEQHIAVGEASPWYLYSPAAVRNIEEYSPNARYIVCLRNPVEMAYSLHEQLVVSGSEHIEDFEKAWNLIDQRRQGRELTRWCRNPRHLLYDEACALGGQLSRLYETVPKERVFTVLLDDLKHDPGSVYRQILAFLGVDDDGRQNFPVFNTSKITRWPYLRLLLRWLEFAKRRIGIRRSLGILRGIDQKNRIYRARPPMSDEMRLRLKHHFKADIETLSLLLARDLSYWLR